MRLIVMGLVFVSAVSIAGYYGVADEIAAAFKVIALAALGLVGVGMLFGGIRVSGRRPELRELPPKVRRAAA